MWAAIPSSAEPISPEQNPTSKKRSFFYYYITGKCTVALHTNCVQGNYSFVNAIAEATMLTYE